jgi:UDP-GlcNAc:undecaprenyl-phosphate/decaprenyl-phosphate GlcNAc-1-phosphate transferase
MGKLLPIFLLTLPPKIPIRFQIGESDMDVGLIVTLLFTFVVALIFFPVLIATAHQKRWVDIPSSRRRHHKPVPIVGGLGIFTLWFGAFGIYALLHPGWLQANLQSLLVFTGAVIGLLTIGLLDDLRGLSPKVKLLGEFLLAAFVLSFEPTIHATCLEAMSKFPPLAHPFLWALAAVWIVGTANAINLVDGIDGFAGGVSLLGIFTVLVLHALSPGGNQFMPVALTLVIPGLLVFLRHNWNPAKIFLGDNGSLTLGFLVACGGLVPTKGDSVLTTIASLLVLMAYPILDMSLSVVRRLRNGYPIFKADRSHLHHRVQRLGLTVPQTTILLLCGVAYFQLSAMIVHLVHVRLAILVCTSTILSLFTLLYLIRCLESWQRESLLSKALNERPDLSANGLNLGEFFSVIEVDLRPLLEVGLWEEKTRAESLIGSLLATVRGSVRAEDRLVVTNQKLSIYLSNGAEGWRSRDTIEERIFEQLKTFQSSFNLQYSVDGLPLEARELRGKVGAA